MEEIKVSTNKKFDVIDITQEVENLVKKVKEGIAVVYTTHTTAALIINENADPNVNVDILNALEKLIPDGKWLHDKIDNNAAAHIKSAIIGCSKAIPIKNGKLTLGTWQSITFMELDGPRQNRKVIVTVIPSK